MSSFPPLSPRCIASFRFVSMVGWRWEKRDPGLGCLCTREGIDDVTFPRVTDPTPLGYVPWDRSEDGSLSPLWVGSVLGSTAKHVGRERGGGTFRHPPLPPHPTPPPRTHASVPRPPSEDSPSQGRHLVRDPQRKRGGGVPPDPFPTERETGMAWLAHTRVGMTATMGVATTWTKARKVDAQREKCRSGWKGRTRRHGTPDRHVGTVQATADPRHGEFNQEEYDASGVYRPLPAPPKSANLLDVMPYLFRLVVSEHSLRWRLAVVLMLMVISKWTGLLVPLLFKDAVDVLGAAPSDAVQQAVRILIVSGICKAVSGVTNEMRLVYFVPIAQAAGRRVALHTFEHILGLDTKFHLERRTGSLSRIIDRGTKSVTMVFRAVIFTFIPTAVELVLVCYLLAKNLSTLAAVSTIVAFAVYVVWTAKLAGKMATLRKEVNRLDQLATGKSVDALLNFETVALFDNKKAEVVEYNKVLKRHQKATIDSEVASSMLNSGQAVVLAAGMSTVLALAAAQVRPGGMTTVGDLVMANGLLMQLWAPLQFLGWFYRELRQSLVDMEAMFDILSTEPALDEGEDTLPSSDGQNRNGNGHFVGVNLEVKDVSFRYPSGRNVLGGVSVDAKPGQSVALVGPSGSGKSTLLKLMLRLYDPDEGHVYIDGFDIRTLTFSSLRSAVAVVPQDTVLFNTTIFENIEYGRPGASREQVVQAAKAARLHEAIMKMPAGYDTMVGERGLKLSGGEKQRVAIARAFLRAPRLLVCDEATSALDSATEAGILDSLKQLAKGRTTIFVAHRLSTTAHCDIIYVMEKGKLVEQGTHQDLMSLEGEYYKMWMLQQAEEAAMTEDSFSEDSRWEGTEASTLS